jgi:hypothetical protein
VQDGPGRCDLVGVQQSPQLIDGLLAHLDKPMADPQPLATAILDVARVVGPRDAIEIAQSEASRDLSGIPPIRLLPELPQIELARVTDQDVHARLSTGVHEPPVEPQCFDGNATVGSKALDECHRSPTFFQALVADSFFGADLSALIDHADLDHGTVQVDSDVRCRHGQLLDEVCGYTRSDSRCYLRS